jgi:Asp-tRNA(Asn)/Glu-tRNA(Gln) amidotransferase A subunit family amidase
MAFPTNTFIASQAWMQSMCVPVRFTSAGLPVEMELVTYPYHEPDLFRPAFAFEQRHAPSQGSGGYDGLADFHRTGRSAP